MKRSGFKPKPTWKKFKSKKGLRPINPRNKNRFVPASILKAVKARSGERCERWITIEEGKNIFTPAKCGKNVMSQPHHIKKRSQGGKHTLENLIDLCFECHRWAEDHPKEAELEGLNKPY